MRGLPGLHGMSGFDSDQVEESATGASAERNCGNERSRLLKAASGDLAAFAEIYCRYRDRLYRFIYRMTSTPATAEDLTHDVFLALIEHPEQYDPAKGRLFTFLCAIARCRVIDQVRRNGKRPETDVWSDEGEMSRPEDKTATTPFDKLLKAELEELVVKAVTTLPPLQRETLLLREYEGLSYEEIAIVVNSSAAVVKARLYRARRLLAAQLGPLVSRNGDKEYGLRKSRA